MPQILRTVALLDRAIPAAGETARIDLPVNPISALLVTIKALNNVPSITTYTALSALFDRITNLNVRYRGATIIDGDSIDLALAYSILSKWAPHVSQSNRVDNDVRAVTFPLLFGRRPYDPAECFPATRRGDLILEWTAAADAGALDNVLLHVETVELLDAQPERFIKLTTTRRIMTAGDTNDVDLPIGNRILGLLLRGDVFPTAASRNASFSEVRLEVDNVEVMFSRAHWETLHGELGRVLHPAWAFLEHQHRVNAAGVAEEDTSQAQTDFAFQQRYAYMDLDPLRDLSYALDTSNAADITLGVVADVADVAASRVLPIEYVQTGAGGAGATGAPTA